MDDETRKEWEKSKRIEAERAKAVKALENDETNKINSGFLDVENTKVKGFSSDVDRILRSIERAAGVSVGLVILGTAVRFAITKIPLPLGVLVQIVLAFGTCMIIGAVIMAVTALGAVIYYRNKTDYRFKNIVITSIVTILIALLYVVLNFSLIKTDFML